MVRSFRCDEFRQELQIIDQRFILWLYGICFGAAELRHRFQVVVPGKVRAVDDQMPFAAPGSGFIEKQPDLSVDSRPFLPFFGRAGRPDDHFLEGIPIRRRTGKVLRDVIVKDQVFFRQF